MSLPGTDRRAGGLRGGYQGAGHRPPGGRLGLIFAFAAAFAWAFFDASRKALVSRIPVASLQLWLTALPVPALVGWWVAAGAPAPDPAWWPIGAGAVLTNVLIARSLLNAMSLAPLGIVVPLLSTTPLVSAVLAYLWAGQVPSGGAQLAFVVELFGVGLMLAGAPRGRSSWAGLAWTFVATGAISLGIVVDRQGVQVAHPGFHGAMVNTGGATVVGLMVLLRGAGASLRLPPRAALPALGSATLALSAQALQLIALQHVLVGVVEGLKRGVGLAVAVLVGRLLFREQMTPTRTAAAAVMLIGVVMLAWAAGAPPPER